MKDRNKILERELDELQGQIDRLEKAVRVEPDFGLGEGDPSITNRQVDRALLERLKKRAETLERTHGGVGQGTHGVCHQCGKVIHPDRLAVLPSTRVCAGCAHNGQNG